MSEVKKCQNCKSDFVIEPEDFAFYAKIQVPPPTWCPECRLVRRMMFQNERSLRRHVCDLCGKDVISIFSKDPGRPVYCQPCWWSDKWDPLSYGREVDFSRPFFEQLDGLFHTVPDFGPQTMYSSLKNSDYCNIASYMKNCYLCFNSDYDEDCAYSTCLERSKNSMDMFCADSCELCYMNFNLFQCSRTFFSNNCNDCIDVWFSRNLKGCTNCFGCANLRNKQYYIFNQPYTKEEYAAKLKEMSLNSWAGLQAAAQKAEEFHASQPRKFMEAERNNDVSGNYIFNSKKVFASYEIFGGEDSKYSQFLFIQGAKDSYDFTMWGGNAQQMYECMGAGNNQRNVKFCYDTWGDTFNMQYCWHILSRNSDIFGCSGLRNSQYCILNKQYTKEEYEVLLPRIIQHMKDMPYVDAEGRSYGYGEFFPPALSAYPYNESIAQKYFPLTKEEALAKGYRWRDPQEKTYQVTLKSEDLPETIQEVADSILEQTISCAHGGSCNEQCATAFKLTREELEFYRRFELPLPRLCFSCRHYSLLKSKGTMRLYERACDCKRKSESQTAYANATTHSHGAEPCPNRFQASYSPESRAIIYCESCYQQEAV